MLDIQMKVLEPKWKQEQRRSVQNKVNKYTNCSSRTLIYCLSLEVKSRFRIKQTKQNSWMCSHTTVPSHCLHRRRALEMLDLSNSNIEHARSNSSEPFTQMAPITHKQLSGEIVIAKYTPRTRVRTIPADESSSWERQVHKILDS